MELEDLLFLIDGRDVTIRYDGQSTTINGKLTYDSIMAIPDKIRHREVDAIAVDDKGRICISLWGT